MNGAPGMATKLGTLLGRCYPATGTFKNKSEDYMQVSTLQFGPARSKSLLVYEYWCRLVEEYSSKDLTVQSDKLPAIQGLARALHKSRLPHKSFHECYYYGLWPEDLAHSLLCFSRTPACQELEHAPSFSWASCSGCVEYVPSTTFDVANVADHGHFNSYADYTKTWKLSMHDGTKFIEMKSAAGIPVLRYADVKKNMEQSDSSYTFILDMFRVKDPDTQQSSAYDGSVVMLLNVLRTKDYDNKKLQEYEIDLLKFPWFFTDSWRKNCWAII